MRLRLLALLACLGTVVTAGDPPPQSRPAPAEVAAELTSVVKARRVPGNIRLDLDADGTISRFEALAACAGQSGWLRRCLPELFRRLDSNRDNTLSPDELLSFALLETEAVFEVRLRTPRKPGPQVRVIGPVAQAPAATAPAAKHVADAIVGRVPYGTEVTLGEVIIVARKR